MTSDRNRRAYDRIAVAYAGPEPGEDDPGWRRQCRELFRSHLRGCDVLEVGCGPGVDADHLSKLGLHVVATDFCKEFVRIARQRYPHVSAVQMDMTDPAQLVAGAFDGIYGHSCFLHIARPLAAVTLKNLWSLLNPGGLLFLSLIESSRFLEYTIPNWGGVDDNPVAFYCYSREEMRTHLMDAGFQDVAFHTLQWSAASSYGRDDVKKRLDERGVAAYQVLGYRRD